MNIRWLLVGLLILVTCSSAQELGDLDWSEETGVTYLFSEPNQSLLIVQSTVGDLSFASNRGIISAEPEEVGVWHVRLEPGVQIVTIRSEGFLPLELPRYSYPRKSVRKIQVNAKAPQLDTVPVVIQVQPSDVDVLIDGYPFDLSNTPKLSVGEHRIEMSKVGYITVREVMEVSEDNIYFEYTLEKPKLSVIEIRTDPPGATVEIDGVRLSGLTPVSDFYNSGRFPITVSLDKYVPVEETITIESGGESNLFQYDLVPNFGTIEITSQPEVNMTVRLNSSEVGTTPLTLREQEIGDYVITSEHQWYLAEPQTFTLGRGDIYRTTMQAQENFAELTVNTTPGARVTLNDTLVSDLAIIRLRPQTIRLLAEKPKCDPADSSLILRRGDRETVDLFVTPRLGTLAISVDPPEARIEVTGDAGEKYSAISTKIFSDIPVGVYEINVSAGGHVPVTQTITVMQNETLRRRIELEEGSSAQSDVTSSGPLEGMTFVSIQGGVFLMGSLHSDTDAQDDEKPRHQVRISPFEIMTTEVTQAMWEEVMGTTVSQQRDKVDLNGILRGESDSHPMSYVNWYETQFFIQRLNQRDSRHKYRLPSEAEWEYACRAGNDDTRFWWGDDPGYSDLGKYAWYSSNSGSSTRPVGERTPNPWGQHDMHGNVWEWCQDWYDSDYYNYSPSTDPKGRWKGSSRVLRGGSWVDNPQYCRSANRVNLSPTTRNNFIGFRLVRNSAE